MRTILLHQSVLLLSRYQHSGPQILIYGLPKWRLNSLHVASLLRRPNMNTLSLHLLLIQPPLSGSSSCLLLSTDAPYATLKAALIKRTAGSNQQKLQRLLTGVELGDQKPTQLLRRMRQLWNDDAGEALLQELFLQRLPANARMVLASSNPTSTLDELAETADRVMEVSVPAISAVANTPRASTAAEIESLRSEVRKLQELMTTMSVNTHSSRHRSPTPFRRRSPSPARHARSGGDHTLCWYHKRFGESATKCHAPCRYQGNEQARC